MVRALLGRGCANGGGTSMRPARYAELRKAADDGTMPSSWLSSGGGGNGRGRGGNAPPPCAIDRHHHWEELPADDVIDFRYGIRCADRCCACKMHRIRMRDGGNGTGGVAYAPRIEYVIWYVACRARWYASEHKLAAAAAALEAPRTGGPSPSGGRAC